MAIELVPDIFEHILINFDIRDLIRFKSVCKSWNSFISSRFVEAHRNHSYNNDCYNNEFGHRRIVMSEFSDSFEFNFVNRYLVGSSNGLVCIYTLRAQFIVANSWTREVRKLWNPRMWYFLTLLCWGFDYDSLTDNYKVIVGYSKGWDRTSFQVFSLKSNDWKVIVEVRYRCISRNATLCNGALH